MQWEWGLQGFHLERLVDGLEREEESDNPGECYFLAPILPFSKSLFISFLKRLVDVLIAK